MSFRITFLGTGGGRYTAMLQARSCGGLLVEHDGHFLHIDPGPGALTAMHRIRYDPNKTECVIVSHCHPDHYSDAPCVIEGMTKGGWDRKGSFYGTATVTEGVNGLGPAISPYHLGLPTAKGTISPGDTVDAQGLKISITRAIHSDPFNVGFRMHTAYGDVCYLSDTEYSEDIGQQYKGARVLILPVTTPYGNRIPWHMSTDGAVEICRQVKPELAVFIHLGIVMLEESPEAQAEMCQKLSGVRTVAGRDLMTLDVGDDLSISDARQYPQDEFWIPDWTPTRRLDCRGFTDSAKPLYMSNY